MPIAGQTMRRDARTLGLVPPGPALWSGGGDGDGLGGEVPPGTPRDDTAGRRSLGPRGVAPKWSLPHAFQRSVLHACLLARSLPSRGWRLAWTPSVGGRRGSVLAAKETPERAPETTTCARGRRRIAAACLLACLLGRPQPTWVAKGWFVCLFVCC